MAGAGAQAFSPDGRTLYTAGDDSQRDHLGRGRRPPARAAVPRPDSSTRPGETFPPAVRGQPRRAHARGREARRPGGPDRRRDAAPDRAASRPSPAGRRSRSSTRPTGAGWRSREEVAASGSGTPGRGSASARSCALPAAPGGTTPTTSRRSPSARAACSPRPEVGGAVRIWDLDRRELRRPAAAPASRACSGWPSAPTARSSRSRSVPVSGTRSRRRRGSRRRQAASGSPGCPPTARSARSPSPPTAACSPAARSTAASLLWATDGWRRVGRRWPSRRRRPTLAVAFSPDGRTLATSHDDGAVVLWDVASQQPIGSPLPGLAETPGRRHASPPTALACSRSPTPGARSAGRSIPSVWMQHACAVAGGGLTPEQWEEVVPEQDYVSVCPSG